MRPLSGEVIDRVRREMLGRGFSLVETPSFSHESLQNRWNQRSSLLLFSSKHWMKYPHLARYACWLEDLVTRALPEEKLSFIGLEFRREPAGHVNREVDRLHADAAYLRAVYTLYGASTIYRENRQEFPVPEGRTLLMTAQDRTRAVRIPGTLHRRPGPGPERAVLVSTFQPRSEEDEAVKIYRQAAAQKPRRRDK